MQSLILAYGVMLLVAVSVSGIAARTVLSASLGQEAERGTARQPPPGRAKLAGYAESGGGRKIRGF